MRVHGRSLVIEFLVVGLLAMSMAGTAFGQSEALTRNYQRGSSLFEAGMYKASTPYFAKALELSESEYGPDSSRTAFILKNLATVHGKQGNFAEAEPLYVRALRIFEDAFGRGHGIVAEVTNELSIVYVERKRFIQAEPLLGRVLENTETTFGPDDSRVAVAAYNYAYASEYLGDSNKARALYARALGIWQSQPVPDDDRIKAAQERVAGLSSVRERKGPSLAPYLPRVLPGNETNRQVTPAPAAKVPAEQHQEQTASGSSSEQEWRVQLASFRSRDTAEKEAERLQIKFSELFAPVGGLKVREAVLKSATYYRVVAEPFAVRAAAALLCGDLKEHRQACLVARQN
jgi:tetratricopeptide (TPR) repeat protein